MLMFIINEHVNILNMARLRNAPDLVPYRDALQKWMPKAEIRPPAKALARFDGTVTWKTAEGPFRYLVQEARHFRHMDAGVVAEQLNRRRADLPRDQQADGILLLAPHVRAEQAAVLERARVDYLDLAGNAHLKVPGLFVHVEGRRPPKATAPGPGRPQKGWIKTVMAILVRPDLAAAPLRAVAAQADVALGTAAACLLDLAARGLLHEGKDGRRIVDHQALVVLWVQAYVEALRPRLGERRFQVRADAKPEIWARLDTVLRNKDILWALTGADAAERRTHFFRAEETEIYAPLRALEDRAIQKALVAQPAARGGNLLVIELPGPLAMPDNATARPPVAPDLLAYAELRYRATGQALEAAEMLLPLVLNHGGR
jgi:hypothetical protein